MPKIDLKRTMPVQLRVHDIAVIFSLFEREIEELKRWNKSYENFPSLKHNLTTCKRILNKMGQQLILARVAENRRGRYVFATDIEGDGE